MKSRTSMKAAVAVGLSLWMGVALARTTAWWHFDEADPGTAAAANTIVDECAMGTYGEPISYAAGTASSSGDYLPQYARPFRGRKVYDPVTGESHTNRSAMAFKIASEGTNTAGHAYYGGAVRFTPPSDGYMPDYANQLTVESFICVTGSSANTFGPIVGNVRSGTAWTDERWALYYQSSGAGAGKIAVRLTGSIWYNAQATDTAVNDGLWHHVAFTYDGTNVRIYVDYKLDRTYGKTGDIPKASADRLYIGGYNFSDSTWGRRRFNGYIDEVRISNAALTPDQFLRLQPLNPPSDPDEVVRIRFSQSGESSELQYAESMTDKFDLQGTFWKLHDDEGMTVYDTTDKAGGRVGAGLFDDNPEANVSALCQTTNAAGKANYIKVPRLTNALGLSENGTNANYTVEAFYKVRRSARGQTLFKIGPTTQVAGHVFFERNSETLLFCYNQNGSWTSLTAAPGTVSDGNWHHVALVSDASNNEVRVYYDYARCNRATNVNLRVWTGCSLFVGGNESSDQFFDGWIDDCRVTKRVLKPEEFLTTHPVGSVSPSPILLARFENDFNMESLLYDDYAITGTGAARTGGTAPTFVRDSPGPLLLDGTNGTELVKNDYSAHMDRSRVAFPISPLFDAFGTCTVEFIAKFTGLAEGAPNYTNTNNLHAGILRLARGTSTDYDWYTYRIGNNPKGIGLATRHQENKSTIDYNTWGLPNLLADGRWHHYAFTFEEFDSNGTTKTRLTLYYDYKKLNTYTINGTVNLKDVQYGHRLMVCESSGATLNLQGEFNALRLSRGVLPVEKFLGRATRGLYIIFR